MYLNNTLFYNYATLTKTRQNTNKHGFMNNCMAFIDIWSFTKSDLAW